MFDVGGTELLVIAVVALVVIGPKDLPRVLRVIGRYTSKARAMSQHLRAGFDEMLRQAELEEMEKQWAEHNARIMAETPSVSLHPAEPEQPPPPETPRTDAPAPRTTDSTTTDSEAEAATARRADSDGDTAP